VVAPSKIKHPFMAAIYHLLSITYTFAVSINVPLSIYVHSLTVMQSAYSYSTFLFFGRTKESVRLIHKQLGWGYIFHWEGSTTVVFYTVVYWRNSVV